MNRKGRLLFAILALFMVSTNGYSEEKNPTVNIKVLNNRSFALYISAIDQHDIQVSIKNDLGYPLSEQKITLNDKGFASKYNMAYLQDGSYVLEIKDNTMTRSFPIEITDHYLDVSENKMIATFKPIIKQDERMVDLMVFSPAQAPHQITIYDENYTVVHIETLRKDVNIQKKFDFTEVEPGAYSMVINTQGHKYTYSIPVK